MTKQKKWEHFSGERSRRLRDRASEEWPWDGYCGRIHIYGWGGELYPRLVIIAQTTQDGSQFHVQCLEKERPGYQWQERKWIPAYLIQDLEEALIHVEAEAKKCAAKVP